MRASIRTGTIVRKRFNLKRFVGSASQHMRTTKSLEARVGFEPTNGGFADLSLGPLGYRAESLSIANPPGLSGRRNRRQHLPSLLFLSGRRRSNFRLAQEACRFFRRRGIDVKAGAPLKPRHFGQLRDDL